MKRQANTNPTRGANKMDSFEEVFKGSLDFYRESHLYEATSYALMSGGKRLRPRILYLVGQALNTNREDLEVLMVALEWIHNYSLIHDDLPGMDNDDYRRGKETVHKKYGEATAILAGDGLLNSAASLVLDHSLQLEGEDLKGFLRAGRALFQASGIEGMIQGQMVDLNPKLDQKDYMKKTAELFKMSFTLPCYLEDPGEEIKKDLEDLGQTFGFLYQTKDDAEDQDRNRTSKDRKDQEKEKFESLLQDLTRKRPDFKDLENFLKEVIYG